MTQRTNSGTVTLSRSLAALGALLDSIDRQRCIFFSGHVLVELDRDHVPAGPLTMVLDEDDLDALRALAEQRGRVVTTPYDDPIVQACIDNGGHFWPDDAPDDEPSTCCRCWFNPGWKAGKPRNETEAIPIRDEPQA